MRARTMRANALRSPDCPPLTTCPSSTMRPFVGACRPRIESATVDLPEPDSPTRPRHSPRFSWRLTPSTARSVRKPRPSRPPPMGKWTARSSTLRMTSSSGLFWGSYMVMAPDEPAGIEPCRLRHSRPANLGCACTTRIEPASIGEMRDRRHDARDLLQPRTAKCCATAEPRQRVDQALCVGMRAGAEDIVRAALLDDAAGIHHGDAAADIGDQAEIVADHQDGGASLGA